MIETAAVTELLGKLKDLKRSGWIMKKVSAPESVAAPLRICDDNGFAALIYRNTRVRRTKVNAYNFSHNLFPP